MWKVYINRQMKFDFIPQDEFTILEVITHKMPIDEAMQLCKILNEYSINLKD